MVSALEIEHRFAWEVARMMDHGFPFDRPAAEGLWREKSGELDAIDRRLQDELGPRRVRWSGKTRPRRPEDWIREGDGWFQEAPVNLSADQQVVDKLRERYGWEPTQFTKKSGQPKFDEDVVAGLPETVPVKADLLRRGELLALQKRLWGQNRATGLIPEAVERPDGTWWIHHYCNHNGARTGRCTHAHPNVNLPRVGSTWGLELRGMVRSWDERVIVGCDMSSVDARMIAHYLAPYDGGRMIDLVTSGNLHDENCAMMREVVPSIDRSTAKNVFYAVAYGAFPRRVGITAGVSQAVGGRLRDLVLERVPGLENLLDTVKRDVRRDGEVRGLDGRVLVPDHDYSALNTLAQGGAAVAMKVATYLVVDACRELMAVDPETDTCLILHVHDEGQLLVPPRVADRVGEAFVGSIREAGRTLGVRCPLDGEFKVGRSWAETH